MKKDIVIKFVFFILGLVIAYSYCSKFDVFEAYNVGQSLFKQEYIWPC